MLTLVNTILVIVDVQGKLANLMYRRDDLYESLSKVIRGAQVLDVPILWAEQNPSRLGTTIPEVAELLTGKKPIAKMSFSCVGCPAFMESLRTMNRNQILVTGIEAHVCVFQTVTDLLAAGYDVEVAADAISSRTKANMQIGLQRMLQDGARITSVEMALFTLAKTTESPQFKELLRIVK
jgi:hypothetical protein